MMQAITALCLCGMAWLFTCAGHRPMVNGVSCGKQFGSPADALFVHNITVEWSTNRVVTCDGQEFWVKFDVPASHVGKKLYVSAGSLHVKSGTPNVTRFAHHRINSLLLGPGLPDLDRSALPDHISVPSNFTTGVYMTSPEDISTCNHSEWMGVMTPPPIEIVDGVCTFYEPFTRYYSTVVLDRTPVAPEAGTYYAGFHFSKFQTGKMWVAVGVVGGIEDFRTTFKIPTGKCGCGDQGMLNGDFYEKVETTPKSPMPMMCTSAWSPTPNDYCIKAESGDDGCKDTLAQTASPIKDCKKMIETSPCGSESWGTKVNDVCKETCGLCEPPCEDTLAQTASPIKDCSEMIKSSPCGSESWGTKVNDVCKKTCGLCGGMGGMKGNESEMNHGGMGNGGGMGNQNGSMGGKPHDMGDKPGDKPHDMGNKPHDMKKCEDTLHQTPSPIKDCKEMIKTAPCGTESWGTKVNDVCKKTCGLCEDEHDGHSGHGDHGGMSMGCGNMDCSVSKAYVAENMKMHMGMSIHFECDTALDFVRGMIPHHQGAVEMCHVMLQAEDETDSGLVHFCQHVIAEQTWENQGMLDWLVAKNKQLGTPCDKDSMMGCGDTSCASSGAFMNANHKMHDGMAIQFTCDAEVDFVQGMIPHHQGAIEMCQILTTNGAPDSYLTELCQNITRTQAAEIMYMSEWLKMKGHSRGASCNGVDYPAGEVCEDMLLLSDTCHHLGGDFACKCKDVIETHECGTISTVRGSSFQVNELCMRTCGACFDQATETSATSRAGLQGTLLLSCMLLYSMYFMLV